MGKYLDENLLKATLFSVVFLPPKYRRNSSQKKSPQRGGVLYYHPVCYTAVLSSEKSCSLFVAVLVRTFSSVSFEKNCSLFVAVLVRTFSSVSFEKSCSLFVAVLVRTFSSVQQSASFSIFPEKRRCIYMEGVVSRGDRSAHALVLDHDYSYRQQQQQQQQQQYRPLDNKPEFWLRLTCLFFLGARAQKSTFSSICCDFFIFGRTKNTHTHTRSIFQADFPRELLSCERVGNTLSSS